jgi:hypothetical protein
MARPPYILSLGIGWRWVVSFVTCSLYRPSYSRAWGGNVTNWILSEEWLLSFGIWRRSVGWKFTSHSSRRHREDVWSSMSDVTLLSASVWPRKLSHLLDERNVEEVGALQSHEKAVSWQPSICLQSFLPAFIPPCDVTCEVWQQKPQCLKIDVFWIVTRLRVLFICGLSNDAVSNTDNMASRDWMSMYYKKFWEDLIAYFPLMRNRPHRKRFIQNCFYCCVCSRCRSNVFTEQLRSNEWNTPLIWAQMPWYKCQVSWRLVQAFRY